MDASDLDSQDICRRLALWGLMLGSRYVAKRPRYTPVGSVMRVMLATATLAAWMAPS